MKKLKQRIVSGFITLCMLTTIIPVSALALDEEPTSQTEEIVIDNEDNTQELPENENQSEEIIQSETENVIEEDEKTDETIINEEQTSEITQNNYNENAELLENAPTSGQCGDNLYWNFDTNTGTLTISGTGDITMNSWSNKFIYKLCNGYDDICTVEVIQTDENITVSLDWLNEQNSIPTVYIAIYDDNGKMTKLIPFKITDTETGIIYSATLTEGNGTLFMLDSNQKPIFEAYTNN